MKFVLAGRFENAIIARLAKEDDARPAHQPGGHAYYDFLYRTLSERYFHCGATFLALGDPVVIPQVDWMPQDPASVGLELANAGGAEWDADTDLFVGLLLLNNAISQDSLKSLREGITQGPRAHKRKVRHHGEVDGFSHHALCRLLLQVRASVELHATLVVTPDEIKILKEIETFTVSNLFPTPYALPSLGTLAHVDGENFLGGMLSFSPPDARSIIEVRKSPTVRKYKEQIVPYLAAPFTQQSEHALLEAMKEAYLSTKVGRDGLKVFEAQSWLLKPLAYIPAIGTIVNIYGDLRDVLKKWLERKTENESWHLIGPTMNQVAIEDYLSRKHNA